MQRWVRWVVGGSASAADFPIYPRTAGLIGFLIEHAVTAPSVLCEIAKAENAAKSFKIEWCPSCATAR